MALTVQTASVAERPEKSAGDPALSYVVRAYSVTFQLVLVAPKVQPASVRQSLKLVLKYLCRSVDVTGRLIATAARLRLPVLASKAQASAL